MSRIDLPSTMCLAKSRNALPEAWIAQAHGRRFLQQLGRDCCSATFTNPERPFLQTFERRPEFLYRWIRYEIEKPASIDDGYQFIRIGVGPDFRVVQAKVVDDLTEAFVIGALEANIKFSQQRMLYAVEFMSIHDDLRSPIRVMYNGRALKREELP